MKKIQRWKLFLWFLYSDWKHFTISLCSKYAPIVFFKFSFPNRATTSRSGNAKTFFISQSGKNFLSGKQLPDRDEVPNCGLALVHSQKKVGKTSQKLFFWDQFAQKGGHLKIKWKTIFFGGNKKQISFQKLFILLPNYYMCFDWVMNLFVSWVMFFVQKRCHLQLKQLLHGV